MPVLNFPHSLRITTHGRGFRRVAVLIAMAGMFSGFTLVPCGGVHAKPASKRSSAKSKSSKATTSKGSKSAGNRLSLNVTDPGESDAGEMRLWRTGRFRGANVALTTSKEDLTDLKSWGANFVRVTVGAEIVDPEPPYGLKLPGLQQLDEFLNTARSAGLRVVMALQSAPGRNSISDTRLWEQPECHLAFARIWKELAQRYRGYPALVGYDLLSEPNPEIVFEGKYAPDKVVGTTGDWNLLAKRLTLAVREADPTRPVVVEAPAWAYARGFPSLKPNGDPYTVYSFHMYSPHKFTHQDAGRVGYPGFVSAHVEPAQVWSRTALEANLQPAIAFGDHYKVPIYVGEFGCIRTAPGAESYLRDLMLLFEEHGWHWSFWGYRGSPDWNPEFGPQPGEDTSLSPARAPLYRMYRDFLALNDHPNYLVDLPLLKDILWVEAMRGIHSRFTGNSGTVGLLGDSITYGHQFFTPLFNGSYLADDRVLADLKRFRDIVPAANADWKTPPHGNRSGWRLTNALPTLPEVLLNDNPEVALVMFGTNDMNDGNPDAIGYPNRLKQYLETVMDNGTVPILSTLPPKLGFNRRVPAFNAVIRRVAKEMNLPLIDFYGAITRRRPTSWYRTLIIGDGVHPSFPDDYQKDMREGYGLRESGFTLRNFLALEAVLAVQDRIRSDD